MFPCLLMDFGEWGGGGEGRWQLLALNHHQFSCQIFFPVEFLFIHLFNVSRRKEQKQRVEGSGARVEGQAEDDLKSLEREGGRWGERDV